MGDAKEPHAQTVYYRITDLGREILKIVRELEKTIA